MSVFHLTRFDNDDGVSSPIRQGATFSIVFNYLGDVASYSPRGQIRSDYASNDGTLLATFSFDPLVYQLITKPNGSQCMATVITAKLSAIATADMPIPNLRKTANDKNVIGTNTYVYDIELEDDGVVLRIVEGLVEVLPEVTT
jgi:hypothetical protein